MMKRIMKINLIALVISLLLGNGIFGYSPKTTETCTVTYIANEGFLISTENGKVLIDDHFRGIKSKWRKKSS